MPNFRKTKSTNWIESDQFGDFDACEEKPTTATKSPRKTPGGRKRTRENNNTIKHHGPSKAYSVPEKTASEEDRMAAPASGGLDPSQLWIQRHHPASVEELAVNTKKIEEVRSWLVNSVDKGGLLVLTGPAGAGKTAVLTSVTRELGMSVQEWVNPIEQVNYNNEMMFDDGTYRYQDTINYVSKSKQFKEWLRGSKYSSLSDAKRPNKVILIEDMPSQKPEELHDILDSYLSSKSKVPIVFIISESPTSKKTGSVKQVFPPQVIEKLRISTINFNPVTTTNMVKTMTRIATTESLRGVRKFRVPDKMTLEHLAESVGGDIRAGINALQFSCLNDTNDLKQAFESVSKIASSKSKGAAKKSDNKVVSELSKIGGKDQGLVMFHALGKILYAKREDTFENQELPNHLQSYARKLLKSNPDEVLEKSTLSADAFNCFLHQNYFPFYSKLEDCQRLSEYFSLGDMFMNEWSHGGKISLTEYGGLVGARATMFCNSAPCSSSGMRKLVKPEHYAAVRRLRQRTHDLQNIFQAAPGRELVTSSLPLISRISPPGLPANKLAIITEVGRFSGFKHVTASNPGLIEQNDVFEEEEEALCEERKEREEDNDVNEADDDEEEIVIEEFDD